MSAGSRRRRVAAIAAVGMLALSGCRDPLLHDLEEPRANSLVLLLETHGVRAEKVRSGSAWSIAVAGGDQRRALGILEHYRTGRGSASGGEASGSFFQSREERESDVLARTALRLEQSLGRIPGVLEARVELSPRRSPGDSGIAAPPATVGALVVAEADGAADESAVRGFIAGATGIQPAAIGLVFVRERPPVDEHAGLATDVPAAHGAGSPRYSAPQVRHAVRAGAVAAAVLVLIMLVVRIRYRRDRRFVPRKPEAVAGGRPGSNAGRSAHAR